MGESRRFLGCVPVRHAVPFVSVTTLVVSTVMVAISFVILNSLTSLAQKFTGLGALLQVRAGIGALAVVHLWFVGSALFGFYVAYRMRKELVEDFGNLLFINWITNLVLSMGIPIALFDAKTLGPAGDVCHYTGTTLSDSDIAACEQQAKFVTELTNVVIFVVIMWVQCIGHWYCMMLVKRNYRHLDGKGQYIGPQKL